MSARPDLPWPPEWRRRPNVKNCVLVTASAAIASVLLLLTGLLVRDAEPLRALVVLVVSGVAVTPAASMYTVRIKPYLRRSSTVTVEPPALCIPYAAPVHRAARAALLVICSGSALIGIAGLLVVPGTDAVEAAAGLVVTVLAAALLVGLPVGYGRGGLALTPSGVTHRTWIHREYVPWEQVHRIGTSQYPDDIWGYLSPPPLVHLYALRIAGQTAAVQRVPARYRPDEPGAGAELEIRVPLLDASPPLVFWLLRFYHRNPGARGELGTDAALRRIEGGAAALGAA